MLGALSSSLFAKPRQPAPPPSQPSQAAPKAPAPVAAAPAAASAPMAVPASVPLPVTPAKAIDAPSLLDLSEQAAAKPAPGAARPAPPKDDRKADVADAPMASTAAPLLDMADDTDVGAAREAALKAQEMLKLEAVLTSLNTTSAVTALVSSNDAEPAGTTDLGSARKAYDEAQATAA